MKNIERFNVKLSGDLREHLERDIENFYNDTRIRMSLGDCVSSILFKHYKLDATSKRRSQSTELKETKPAIVLPESKITNEIVSEKALEVWRHYKKNKSSEEIALELGNGSKGANVRKHMNNTVKLLGAKSKEDAFQMLKSKKLI